jgi:hypothetical protein
MSATARGLELLNQGSREYGRAARVIDISGPARDIKLFCGSLCGRFDRR